MEEHLQRLLLAGVLGLTMARKAAAILDITPLGADLAEANLVNADPVGEQAVGEQGKAETHADTAADAADGAVLRAILDAANECLGLFDDRPPSERWCDAMLHLLDLARFAAELG